MRPFQGNAAGCEAGNGKAVHGAPMRAGLPGTGASESRGPHCETADIYSGELVRLGGYRVAVCRDGLQWLLQRRRPGYAGVGPAWRTVGYCVTRDALIRLGQAHMGSEAVFLLSLPARFVREGAR